MNLPPPVSTQSIPNHLAWAIISMIVSFCLCCFVGGIPGVVAIVYAAQVNSELNHGNEAGARRASDNAKTWCWVATALAVLGVLLNVGLFMSGGAERYLETMQQIQQMSQ
jgi:hypothetical protein